MVDDGILTGGLMAVENVAQKAARLIVTLPQAAFARLTVSLKKAFTGL